MLLILEVKPPVCVTLDGDVRRVFMHGLAVSVPRVWSVLS